MAMRWAITVVSKKMGYSSTTGTYIVCLVPSCISRQTSKKVEAFASASEIAASPLSMPSLYDAVFICNLEKRRGKKAYSKASTLHLSSR
jgi:hypothetical protein